MKKIAVVLVMLVITITNPAIANTANDEQAVRKVLASFDEAFNRHDADAVAALYTDDAEFINISGMWWRGKAEIRRGTAFVLANIFQNTTIQTDSVSVRFPTRDTAIAVIAQHTVGSFVLPDGTRIASTNARLTVVGSTGRCNTIWYKAVFKGGVYDPREAVWAFGGAEERHVASLEGGTVVA